VIDDEIFFRAYIYLNKTSRLHAHNEKQIARQLRT